MKIIKLKPVAFSKRYFDALFPNRGSLLLYFLVGLGFYPLFHYPYNKAFWIGLLLYLPLPVYVLIIKPYIESKIYITQIALDEINEKIVIDYFEINFKKQTKISLQHIKYNIIYSGKISLAARIIFYNNDQKVLKQYSNSKWTVVKIEEVAQTFKEIGIKRPYGYNL